jgi:hypothetical protein
LFWPTWGFSKTSLCVFARLDSHCFPFQAFLKLRGLTKQHIDSFNYFLNVEMRTIVQVFSSPSSIALNAWGLQGSTFVVLCIPCPSFWDMGCRHTFNVCLFTTCGHSFHALLLPSIFKAAIHAARSSYLDVLVSLIPRFNPLLPSPTGKQSHYLRRRPCLVS